MSQTPNMMAALAFLATIPAAVEYGIEYLDAGDCLDSYFDTPSVLIPRDTMFQFGEGSEFVVLVEEGKVVSWAGGGFSDNRGEDTEWYYVITDDASVTYEGVEDADYEFSIIYDELYRLLKANPCTDKV